MILETASSLKDQIISYEDLIKEAKLPVDLSFTLISHLICLHYRKTKYLSTSNT